MYLLSRAMVEMTAEDMKNAGTLSMAEREAIAHTSGHSYSSTVRDYYLRDQRIRDIEGSKAMFAQLREGEKQDEVDDEIASEEGTDENIGDTQNKWGTSHPCYTKDGGSDGTPGRIRWSKDEIALVGRISRGIKASQGDRPKKLFSQILAKIVGDPSIHHIFHEHHVLDSTRYIYTDLAAKIYIIVT